MRLKSMENLPCLSAAERLYGLSLIWQEANYNFAFFDRVPGLDWEASYRDYIPSVLAAEDIFSYYALLERFIALLNDGHTFLVPPKALLQRLDRPKLALMNIGGAPVVTNVSQSIGRRVPIGSQLCAIDGIRAEEYLSSVVLPVVCETTPHRRKDHAMARLLLGQQGSTVHCAFLTPGSESVDIELTRNRRTDADAWLRPSGVPDRNEFMYIGEMIDLFYNEASFTAFEFNMLEGNLAYVALNTFMDPSVVTSFEEKLPALRGCSGIILDLRKNHGGQDDNAYRIASYFLRQPAERLLIHTRKNIANFRAAGSAMKDTPPDRMANLAEWQRESLLCYRKQWFEELDWGQPALPASEPLDRPTAILTGSETGSASEDLLMALVAGQSEAIRIGVGTAGSSGQPLMEELPGGGMLAICTVRMPWPEEVARKGIEPHIRVEPTVEDVIRGEDPVLKEAVRCLKDDKP
jgi:C-terminal processing protease CtpA/Prc